MTYQIEWKEKAISDLTNIGQRIAKDSPKSAATLLDLIESKVAALASHPQLGRSGRKRGTRELVTHEHYIVIYRILKTTIVEILRVKHTAQQWP